MINVINLSYALKIYNDRLKAIKDYENLQKYNRVTFEAYDDKGIKDLEVYPIIVKESKQGCYNDLKNTLMFDRLRGIRDLEDQLDKLEVEYTPYKEGV